MSGGIGWVEDFIHILWYFLNFKLYECTHVKKIIKNLKARAPLLGKTEKIGTLNLF